MLEDFKGFTESIGGLGSSYSVVLWGGDRLGGETLGENLVGPPQQDIEERRIGLDLNEDSIRLDVNGPLLDILD